MIYFTEGNKPLRLYKDRRLRKTKHRNQNMCKGVAQPKKMLREEKDIRALNNFLRMQQNELNQHMIAVRRQLKKAGDLLREAS